MSSRNGIRNLRDKNQGKKVRNRAQGRKLLLEQLEDRRLLAVGAMFDSGTLTVSLDGADDHAFISFDSGNIRVGTSAGSNNVYSSADSITSIAVVDAGANANQQVTFSGASAITSTVGGVLSSVTVAGIETANVAQSISVTTISGDADVANVETPGRIQHGVNLVVGGGTVNVAAGTHQVGAQLQLNKPLTLQGESAANTLVEFDPAVSVAVRVTADNVTVKNLHLRSQASATSGDTYVIDIPYKAWGVQEVETYSDFTLRDATIEGARRSLWIHANNLTIENTNFLYNGNRQAIQLRMVTGETKIVNNTFNGGAQSSGAIVLEGISQTPWSGSLDFSGNTVTSFTQFVLLNMSNLKLGTTLAITNNTIDHQTRSGSSIIFYAPNDFANFDDILIQNNAFHNPNPNRLTVYLDYSYGGSGVPSQDQIKLYNNTAVFSTPWGRTTDTVHGDFPVGFSSGSPTGVSLAAFDLSGNVTLTSPAPLVYVDSQWAGTTFGEDPDNEGPAQFFGVDSFVTIQEGINAVAEGGTVMVSAGTYLEGAPTDQRWAVYINKPVTLLGAQAGVDARDRSGPETVVDAQGYGVGVYIDGGGAGTVIDGFEVKNTGYYDQRGAGIGLENGAHDVTIRNTYVHSNSNQGIQSFQRNSLSVISDGILIEYSRLENNGDSGVKVYGSSNVTLQDSLLSQNGEFGLLVWNYRTPAAWTLDNVQILRNQFLDNYDNIKLDGDTKGITNAVVAFNEVSDGRRGIEVRKNVTSPQIHNNTITGNDVGIHFRTDTYPVGDDLIVSNNSIHGNTEGLRNDGTATVDASGNWWGNTSDTAIEGLITGPGPVDFTPYLASGTDTSDDPGFQGDFSTLYVTEKGAQTQSGGRINEAIGLVDGSTVIVNAGTYNERVTIDKPLTLLGAQAGVDARGRSGAESIVTEAGLATPNPDILVEVTAAAANSEINGFTLYGDPSNTTSDTSTIRIWADGTSVTNNIIDGRVGALIKGGASQLLNQNLITANKNGVVVQPNPASNVTISNNQIKMGMSPAGDESGIYMTGVTGATISGNTVTGFTGRGIGGSNWTDVEITGNTLTTNRDGISIWGDTTLIDIVDNDMNNVRYGISIKGQDVRIDGNTIANSDTAGINIENHTLVTQRVTISDNTLTGNATGIRVATTTLTPSGPLTFQGNSITGGTNAFVISTVGELNLTNNTTSGTTSGGSITSVTTVNLDTNDSPNTLRVNVNGAGAIALGQFSVDGQLQAITYTGVTTLSVDTLGGDDTVHVAPHETTVIELNGNLPNSPLDPGEDGDALIYHSDGTAYSFGPNKILTSGKADIDHQQFENFATAGLLVINGTGLDDLLDINATNANSGTYQLTSGGVPGPVVAFSGITSLAFDAGDGYDILRINNPAGGVFAPDGGVIYDGGPNTTTSGHNPAGDSLELLGGLATSVEHRLLTASSGEVQYDGSTGTDKISYTGLEPVLDTVAAIDRTFTFKGAGETITLSDDANTADGMSLIDSDLSEGINFLNPSGSLTIKTTDTAGGDAINVQGVDSAFNAALTITAKSTDSVVFQTVNTNIGAGHFTATAGSFQFNANLTTMGNATITAQTGSILDNSDDNNPNLAADQVSLTINASGQKIGTSTSDRFELNASRLTVNGANGTQAFLRDTEGGVQLSGSSVGADGTYDLVAVLGNIVGRSDLGGGRTRDVGAGTIVLAITGSGTIGTGISQNRLFVNAVARLDATTANQSMWLRDTEGSFPLGLVNAGTGNVDLHANGGSMVEATAGTGTNIIANHATLLSAGTIGGTGGNNALDTQVTSLHATAGATGGIWIKETDAVTLTSVTTINGTIEVDAGGTMTVTTVTAGGSGDVRLTTSSGDIALGLVTAENNTVLLQAAGAITDNNAAVNNVTASELAMVAGSSIGAADAIESTVGTVAALSGTEASDDIWVVNDGNLVIGSVTAFGTTVAGVTGGGNATITALGALTVANHVSMTGSVLLTATDKPTAGDDLTVNTGVTVQSSGSNVELRAGDNMTLADCSTVIAATTITLKGDYGNADPNVGSTMQLLGTLNANGTSGNISVEGNSDADTITVNPGAEHTADGMTIDGKAGNDTYHIYLGRLNGGENAVLIQDTGGGTDTAFVYGTGNPDTLTVHNNVANGGDTQTGGFVQLSTPSEKVNYTETLEFLTVDGGAGADTFLVQPSQTAEITIVGGMPTFGPAPDGFPTVAGDTIEFDSFGERFNVLCGRIYTLGGDPNAFQVVRYFGIENLPLDSDENPIGTSELHFDFDWTPAETQSGYTSVLPTTLYGGANTFGWSAVVNGFDRGAAMVPDTTFIDLLRDGHWESGSRTFSADVANGWYLVSVKTGDASFARDRLQVVDANTATELVARVDSTAGQFEHPTFVVLVEEAVPESGMGTLALTFNDLGGDPYWSINGLDIWPGSLLGIGSPDPGPMAADGLTVETFTGYGATPNSLITVSAWLDATGGTADESDGVVPIISDDIDDRLAGVQVETDGNGQFSYSFLRPSAAGALYVQFSEPTGEQLSCQTFQLAQVDYHRFDFDGPSVDTQGEIDPYKEFLSVRGGDVFTRLAGYGWNQTMNEFERSAAPGLSETATSLYRDGHWHSATRTFQFQAVGNQEYDLRVYTGDRSFARDQLQITVEGVASPVGPITTAANEFAKVLIEDAQDLNNDGYITVTFTNLGGDPYWVVNGIDVAKAGELPDEPEPLTPVLGGLRFDFNSAANETADDYIGVGTVNAFDALTGHGWSSTASTFSRSISDDLLKDGHYGGSNTFNVNLANGEYFVNVTFGDANFARNNLAVKAEGAAQPQLSGIATAAGQFVHQAFPVTVADGQLNLQIYSAGGDPYFTINALEVWPMGTVVNHGLTVAGNAVTGTGAWPNAVITVSTTLGSVSGTDVDTARAGLQVQADGAGEFSFTFNPPAGGGTAMLRSLEVDGGGRGEETVIVAVPAVRRFDFNGSGNFTETTTDPVFTGVRGNTLYNANNGYGWTQAVPEFQRAAAARTSVALYRDGHYGSAARTFQVAAIEDTVYSVRVYVGDASFLRNNIQISVEGGAWQNVANTAANEFATLVVTGTSINDDGLLTISIRNNGGDPYWVINGMDVWIGAGDPGAANLLAAAWSGEMVGGQLTQSALDAVLPVAREYWVSTGVADWQVAELYRTPVAIGDLSYRGALGVAKPEGIWLDASGAGLGWSVGSGQWAVVSGSQATANGQLPTAAYDLLTVVTHELGHVLGYDDLDPLHHSDHLMAEVLQPGVSRIELPVGGQGWAWTTGEDSTLLSLDRTDEGSLAATGLLVDRVIDDLLQDDLRVSKDAWQRDEEDEFEPLLTSRSDQRYDDFDDFFAQL